MKKMCLVDVTQPAGSGDHSPDVADAPWKLGFAECPGKQNRFDCDILLLAVPCPPFCWSFFR